MCHVSWLYDCDGGFVGRKRHELSVLCLQANLEKLRGGCSFVVYRRVLWDGYEARGGFVMVIV